jgi:hypothetical protein
MKRRGRTDSQRRRRGRQPIGHCGDQPRFDPMVDASQDSGSGEGKDDPEREPAARAREG